jgi:hypothetical protein
VKLRDLLIGEWNVRRVIRSLVLILGCVLAYLVYLSFSADRLIFLPPEPSYQNGPEVIRIDTTDGQAISARYLPGPAGSYTVLYSHGNAEDLGHVGPVLADFQRHGFSVLAYDYHGYGTSTGTPSESHAYQAADAAYRYLVDSLKTPPGRIVVCGRSLGGAMAVFLAATHPVAGLVVESGFVSAARVALPVRVPFLDRFDSAARMGRVTCPVFVVHGGKDDVIPQWHGRELYRLAPDPKLHLWVESAGHNDLMEVAGTRYWERLGEFMTLVRAHGHGPRY